MKKDETNGINNADGDDKSDEGLPSILVLIGSRISLMRRGLLSHHLVDLSHLTWVRSKYNEQPVGIDNDGWSGGVEINNNCTTRLLQAERCQLGLETI